MGAETRLSPFYCFFFSSRRRHTRLQGDWSSDVCSSDLLNLGEELLDFGVARYVALEGLCAGQRANQIMSFGFHPFVLVSNGQFGAGIAQTLGNGPGNAAFIGNSKDNHILALHAQHRVMSSGKRETSQNSRKKGGKGV